MMVQWNSEFYEKYKDIFPIDVFYIAMEESSTASSLFYNQTLYGYQRYTNQAYNTIQQYPLDLSFGYVEGKDSIMIFNEDRISSKLFRSSNIGMKVPDEVSELFTDLIGFTIYGGII